MPRSIETAECQVPPEGWSCSREPGHEGPCAASPSTSQGLASYLYATLGADGLRGHPLYESAKAFEDAQQRRKELFDSLRGSDRKQFDKIMKLLDKHDPVMIIAPCFNHRHGEYLFNALRELRENEWDMVRKDQFALYRASAKRSYGKPTVIIVPESTMIEGRFRGYTSDYVVMHDDTTWRAYQCLAGTGASMVS